MRSATRLFVGGIVTAALAGTLALYWHSPAVPPEMLSDALILCALAISAELLAFLLPVSATGSIGFIRGRCLQRLKKILEEKGF